MPIEVKVDASQIRELNANFTPQQVARYIFSASKKTANGSRVIIYKRLKGVYRGLKKKDLYGRNLQIIRDGARGFRVKVTGARIPLTSLGARERKRGVSYVKVGGGRKTIADAFFGTRRVGSGAGKQAVFSRTGEKSLPITELRGPSIPQLLENEPGMLNGVQEEVVTLLRKNVASQIDRALKRKRS